MFNRGRMVPPLNLVKKGCLVIVYFFNYASQSWQHTIAFVGGGMILPNVSSMSLAWEALTILWRGWYLLVGKTVLSKCQEVSWDLDGRTCLVTVWTCKKDIFIPEHVWPEDQRMLWDKVKVHIEERNLD